MYKKIIITFLLVFSAFLGFNRVSAEIAECSSYYNCSEEAINRLINTQIQKIPEYKYFIFQSRPSNSNYKDFVYIYFFKGYDGFQFDDGSTTSGDTYKVIRPYEKYYYTEINLTFSQLPSNYDLNLYYRDGKYVGDTLSFGTVDLWSTRIGNKWYGNEAITYTNIPTLKQYDNSNFTYTKNEEFTIWIIDTEFDYKYGVNYVKGEQDNTIEYYLQDSGILMDTHAKGYEIDKIYYDESLTKEAFLDDILEVDTTLYVTWKSKIDITSEVKKDSSSNDVISITYDFSKIYNENYTYWVSNDGENYVDITNQLNEEKKYISDVYFFGRYYARVQDETKNTISVNHIRIKYYYISINSEVGSEIDDEGNILPFIILDYSAYKNIKDNLIFEYSIDDGKKWVNVTNRLDSNFKYKLYVKIGDKVKTRVRTNGSTVLPGSSTGSDYVIDEDFINSLLTNDNFEFTLNKFLKPIKFIISSITEFYNDFCPPIVQNFFYLSFIILIVLFIIRLIW